MFQWYSKTEYTILRYLISKKIYFFTEEDLKNIFQEKQNIFSINIEKNTIRKLMSKLILKNKIWNLIKWVYFLKTWLNWEVLYNTWNLIIKYLWIIWWNKKLIYYFWWNIQANQFWLTEQIWTKYVIYNNIIVWKRSINWIQYLFRKIEKWFSSYINKKDGYNYSTIEQTIIDCLRDPWYIWWNFENIIRELKKNKNINIDLIIKLYKINNNKSWFKRFQYLLLKSWKQIKEIKSLKLNTNIRLNKKTNNDWILNSTWKILTFK